MIRSNPRPRRRSLITYSGLAAQVTRFALAPELYALHDLIGENARSEDAAGRGILSALVVHKHGDQMPSQGFFTLARHVLRVCVGLLDPRPMPVSPPATWAGSNPANPHACGTGLPYRMLHSN